MKVGFTVSGQHPMQGSEMLLDVAEMVGADSVWVPDHILGVFHPGLWADMAYSAMAADPDAFYDPFVVLGLLGQRTSIPMGVSVTDATRRRAPDLARTALTLHHVTKGGFHLGIGSGEAESLTTFGYDFSRPVGVLEECLVELRSLLDTGNMPGGRSGRMGIPLVRDDLGHGPKVWVAGHGPRMLRLTGEHGDGWLPAWPMSGEEYGRRKQEIAAVADRCNRPAPEAGLLVFMMVGESKEYIADLMEKDPLGKLFALFCPADRWAKHGYEHPFGADCKGFIDLVIHDLDPEELRELAPRMPFELVEEVVFMGSPEELTERVADYATNGLEHIVVGNLTGVVGGMEEIAGNMERFVALRSMLGEL